MKVEMINLKNEKAGIIELNDKIFGVRWNPDLVHQTIVAQTANSRDPWAHAKGRSEVRGGGKKPWKQKGTGRARHGSIRSPLWIGGGVTHGPLKERDFSKKINKKMKRLAVFSVLSKKLKDKELIVVDKFDGLANKTKEWTNVLKNLADLRLKTTLILETKKKNFSKAVANIKKIDTISPKSLNVYDLLNNKKIIIEAKAIEEIEKNYKHGDI
ncbi:50S ribosomal protein L4 [Candidatus Wolfebacteria bacterium]|nr:50S ribosomal protein L4 [Candidatus Wolfebacteria bacterium]